MPEPIVTLNEETLKSDLRELVRRTVEDTLNGLLEEEADDLVGAERYERTAELCLVKSHLRKRARPSFGFQHASFSVSGAGTPLAS